MKAGGSRAKSPADSAAVNQLSTIETPELTVSQDLRGAHAWPRLWWVTMIHNFHPDLEDDNGAEDRRAALGFVTEAFAEAILSGLEGDSFAHAALFAAFQELVDAYGEDAVAVFAERLPERIRQGEFSVARKH